MTLTGIKTALTAVPTARFTTSKHFYSNTFSTSQTCLCETFVTKLWRYIDTVSFLMINILIHKFIISSHSSHTNQTDTAGCQGLKHEQSANQVPQSCTQCMCLRNVLPWRLRQAYLQVNAGLVPSNIWWLQLLDKDDDDPDEEHEVNLIGRNKNKSQCRSTGQKFTHPSYVLPQWCWILNSDWWGLDFSIKAQLYP